MSELYDLTEQMLILSRAADFAKSGAETIEELRKDAFAGNGFNSKAVRRLLVYYKTQLIADLQKIPD